MKIEIVAAKASQVETECLVLVALDYGEKEKCSARLVHEDKLFTQAAEEIINSGELSGKLLETVMLYRPQGARAKRVLIIGGGKANKFNPNELRKIAGTAVRYLKPKGIRSLTLALPEKMEFTPENAVRAVVVGALVGNFDPDTYKSDRKDQSIQSLTIVAPENSDKKDLDAALAEGRIIGNRRTLLAN